MPIDTSIYNNIRPVQIESPLNMLAQATQLKGLQQSNKLAELKLAESQRATEQGNALNEAFKNAVGVDGQLNRQQVISGAAQAGLGSRIPDLQKTFADQDKAQSDADKARLDGIRQHLEVQAQLLGNAKDQNSWAQSLQAAQQFGIDTSKLPQQYDPAFVKQAQLRALTAAQQVDQEWKEKGYNLDVSKFGETQRHNQATEQTARGNLAVAQANLGVSQQRLAHDKTKGSGGGKPLPTTALKMQQEELDAINTSSSIQADLGAVEKQIADGKLKFGVVRNAFNKAKNMAGMSDEESRNLSSFRSSLEKLRNDSLRLNNGVQTEGDAQRAWNELFENINDTNLVKQRLAEIKKINERAVNHRKMKVDAIRSNYGHDPLDTSGFERQEPAIGARPTQAGPNIDDLLKKYGG